MKKAFAALLFLVPLSQAHGLSCLSAATGNWSAPATWTGCGGGVPSAADDVTVRNGHTVTVNTSSAAARSVAVNVGTLKFSTSTASALSLAVGDVVINNGGTLSLGTPAAPIGAAVTATLVLAPPNGATRHGLTVLTGGQFVSQGAAKVPVALATGDAPAGATALQVPDAQVAGWRLGDTITIGQTETPSSPPTSFQDQTEERGITGLSSAAGLTTVSWSGGLIHSHLAADGLRVANLTRNARVVSAGTDLDADTAYVQSDAAGGFSAALTEFAYLGKSSAGGDGLALRAAAILSSSTVRSGNAGVFAGASGPVVLSHNVFYRNQIGIEVFAGGASSLHTFASNEVVANAGFGVWLYASENILSGNNVYSNGTHGVALVFSDGNVIEGNTVYANGDDGIVLSGGGNTFLFNTLRANRGNGVSASGADEVFAGNLAALNGGDGFSFSGGGGAGTFVSNEAALNGGVGFNVREGAILMARSLTRLNQAQGFFFGFDDSTATVVESAFGYDAAGVSQQDGAGGTSEFSLWNNFGSNHNLTAVLRACRINPAAGLSGPGSATNAMISYNQDFATGTVRVTGDARVDGETWTLDHAQPLWRASASTPVLMRGTGHAASVAPPSDATAVTQLVSIRCVSGAANQWVVEGSSSGAMFGPFTGPLSGQSIGGQFALTFTPGGSPRTDDRMVFVVLAASQDQNRAKSLLFEDADNFNGGRSRLTVAPGAGLVLRGIAGTPAVMDKAGANAYAFVSSGSFTLENASVQDMDAAGLELSGAGGVSMSSVTFDGISAPGGAYLVPRGLASHATFYNLVFNDTPGRTPVNVDVQGADAGLRWYVTGFSGSRSGDNKDNDPNQRVLWADTAAPDAPTPFAAATGANTGEIQLSWTASVDRETDGSTSSFKGASFRLFRSTAQAQRDGAVLSQAQLTFSTTSAPGTAWSVADAGRLLAQTYYYRLWAADEFSNAVSLDASAVAARVTPAAPSNFTASLQNDTDILLSWSHASVPPAAYRGPYLLEISTVSSSAGFGAQQVLSSTSTSYLHPGLLNETTYYYRLYATDTGGGPAGTSTPAAASSKTADIAPPQVTPSAGARTVGVALTQAMTLAFTKAMQPATVAGAVSFRRLRDNLGQDVNQDLTGAVSISSDVAGFTFTVTPGAPLLGNSVYELSVATAATDTFGKTLASSTTLRFVTLMDRTVRNVVTEGAGGAVVDVPAGAFAVDGYINGAAASAGAAQATQKLLGLTGDSLRVPVAGGTAALEAFDAFGAPQAFASPVTVSLPYIDADGDGAVDGTLPAVQARTLAVHWLDEPRNVWVRLNSSVDPASRRVTALAPHFTTFAAIGQASADLSGAHAYPSPWRASAGGNVTFTAIGQGSEVRVYDAGGRLVRTLADHDIDGQAQWDVRDDEGSPVPSGVYYFRVIHGGEEKTGKLAVIR